MQNRNQSDQNRNNVQLNVYNNEHLFTLIPSDAEARDSSAGDRVIITRQGSGRDSGECVGSCPGKAPVLRWTTGRIRRSSVRMN